MTPDHLYAYDTCHRISTEDRFISIGDGTLSFCGIQSDDTGICARYSFSRNDGTSGQYQRCNGRRCGDENSLARYHSDHRECQCLGWAEPTAAFVTWAATHDMKFSPTDCECNVIGANPADCECPTDATYDPETHSCGCPDRRDIRPRNPLLRMPRHTDLLLRNQLLRMSRQNNI